MSCCVSILNETLLRALPAVLVAAALASPAQAQGRPAQGSPTASPVQAAAPAPEQQVRGIGQVVTGIASYVKWPVAQAELQLCVAGETRYAETLLDGTARARNQPIHSIRLPAGMPGGLGECDIVYLGSLPVAERRQLLDQLSGQPVLSISEPALPCADKVMFCLKLRDEQIAFEANLDAINQSGLRVHPNVLQLARRKAAP